MSRTVFQHIRRDGVSARRACAWFSARAWVLGMMRHGSTWSHAQLYEFRVAPPLSLFFWCGRHLGVAMEPVSKMEPVGKSRKKSSRASDNGEPKDKGATGHSGKHGKRGVKCQFMCGLTSESWCEIEGEPKLTAWGRGDASRLPDGTVRDSNSDWYCERVFQALALIIQHSMFGGLPSTLFDQ